MNNPLRLEQIKNPFVRYVIRKISKIDVLEKLYDEWLNLNAGEHGDSEDFIEYIITKFDIRNDIINKEFIDSIPRSGSVVIVANHPLGGLEGVLLSHILLKIRPDLKVLTNELLRSFPEFQNLFIGVDVLNANKQHENAKGIRDVARHLSQAGALLVFPAGTVSRINPFSMKITDAPWSLTITRLARKYNAPIVPVFVSGRNSLGFYLSGLVHKRLRTILLPRAMIKKFGQRVLFVFGMPIPAVDIQRLDDDEIATSYIRLCCKVLKNKAVNDLAEPEVSVSALKKDVDQDVVSNHVATLEEYILYAEDNFSLYCLPHDALGPVAEQLAIERERTFRLVDEGTGNELDCDYFDPHYQHLFLWDKKGEKIAGGYRIGITADIIKTEGLRGLYSHSLFDYNQKFIEGMGNTIELGRSFVTENYQRQPKALDMLWKGIGRFVARHPTCHTLFGCVSISRQYSTIATALLTDTFLYNYGVDHAVKRKVKARKPLNNVDMPWTEDQIKNLSKIPILNKLVGRIDEGKSIPVLIRHYLALNGQFVSFTVNEGFNRSLDGLIIVDLRNTKEKYLKRYMGKEGLEKFKTQWKGQADAA